MTKEYRFVDYATQAYIALVGLIVLLFHNHRVIGWQYLVAAHCAVFLLVHGLIKASARAPGNRTLDFLRHFYPVLLYTGFYRETGTLNQMFVPEYVDAFFIRMDQRLFGFQPCIAFMDCLPYLAVSEIFYAAYFSYYVMIGGVGLALFVRSRKQFFHYVSIVSFVFYVCYLTYIFLPVMGPRSFFREIDGFRLPLEVQNFVETPSFPEAIKSGLFYQIMAIIYRYLESPGAAFPSSHVAIAIVTVWFSFRYLPAIRYVHLVTVVLLCMATVYGRYHFVVDVLAGALTATILIPVGNRLYECIGPKIGHDRSDFELRPTDIEATK